MTCVIDAPQVSPNHEKICFGGISFHLQKPANGR